MSSAAIGRQIREGLRLDKLFARRVPRGHAVTLERRRIYALPTRYGVVFAIMLFVMLLGSINYNNSLGFMLTFLLASLALISILYTYRNIAHLEVRAGRGFPAFAGGEARFILHAGHRDALRRVSLRIAVKGGAAKMIDLAPRGNEVCELALPAPRRGRLALPRLTISTTFPLGLIRAWSYAELDMHCLVYPQPAAHAPEPQTRAQELGERSGGSPGSDDFLGFRDYQRGDSPRHVHWKALARELPLLTKQFAASVSPECWLDWSALPPLDVEARLRLLCRGVIEAERLGQRYGLRIPGTSIAPGLGDAHRQRCLEALALYEAPRA